MLCPQLNCITVEEYKLQIIHSYKEELAILTIFPSRVRLHPYYPVLKQPEGEETVLSSGI